MSITIKLNVTVIDSANYLFELVDHGDPSFTTICNAFFEKLQTHGEVKRCPATTDAIRAFVTTDLANHEFLARADEIFRGNAHAFNREHHNIRSWSGERLFKEFKEPSGPAELLPSARHFLKMW